MTCYYYFKTNYQLSTAKKSMFPIVKQLSYTRAHNNKKFFTPSIRDAYFTEKPV